jgi:hypothetical protein
MKVHDKLVKSIPIRTVAVEMSHVRSLKEICMAVEILHDMQD